MWYIWLILAGIFAIAEIITPSFLIIWLSAGSLCSMVTSFFTDNLVIQIAVFVISSAIFIFFTRPLAKKLTKKDKDVVTNAFAIVGKKAVMGSSIFALNRSTSVPNFFNKCSLAPGIALAWI